MTVKRTMLAVDKMVLSTLMYVSSLICSGGASANMLLTNNSRNNTIIESDICQSSYFEPVCGQDEVIVMVTALYGRMRVGSCASGDFHTGCSEDVLNNVDRKCSGRRECRVRALDEEFGGIHPCHVDLKSYLQVSYTCVSVIRPHQACHNSAPPRVLRAPSGYIASTVSDMTGCGLADAPWVIEVRPGQKINITLFDFSQRHTTGKHGDLGPSGYTGIEDIADVCRVYATIREISNAQSKTVCAHTDRIHHEYISRGNRVEIRILNSQTPNKPNYFLLKYEVVGCPVLEAPANGWVQQDIAGLMRDVAKFGCDSHRQTWTLTCSGTEWKGENQTCSPDTTASTASAGSEGFLSLSVEMCIVLIIILAFSVGLFILILGLLCIKWKHLPACCRCSRVPGGNNDRSRDNYTMKTGAVVADPHCGSATYTYTTKLANNDLIYHQDHDFACSRLLGNTMPDIMHNNQDQSDLSHHMGHCHDVSYDSPARHTSSCQQQRTYDTAPCSNAADEHCIATTTSSAMNTTTNTAPLVAENPYGTCMQHYIDVGPSNCVSLVPCSSYLAPVTVASPGENTPSNVSTNSTSTFGKPQIRDVTYMTSAELATAKTGMPNQSCVTVNDGLCTVSVCDPDTRPFEETYSSVAKNNKL